MSHHLSQKSGFRIEFSKARFDQIIIGRVEGLKRRDKNDAGIARPSEQDAIGVEAKLKGVLHFGAALVLGQPTRSRPTTDDTTGNMEILEAALKSNQLRRQRRISPVSKRLLLPVISSWVKCRSVSVSTKDTVISGFQFASLRNRLFGCDIVLWQ